MSSAASDVYKRQGHEHNNKNKYFSASFTGGICLITYTEAETLKLQAIKTSHVIELFMKCNNTLVFHSAAILQAPTQQN